MISREKTCLWTFFCTFFWYYFSPQQGHNVHKLQKRNESSQWGLCNQGEGKGKRLTETRAPTSSQCRHLTAFSSDTFSSPCSDVTAVTADNPFQVCFSWLISLAWYEERSVGQGSGPNSRVLGQLLPRLAARAVVSQWNSRSPRALQQGLSGAGTDSLELPEYLSEGTPLTEITWQVSTRYQQRVGYH